MGSDPLPDEDQRLLSAHCLNVVWRSLTKNGGKTMSDKQQPEKMTGKSLDISEQRHNELKQLFPGVFTETIGTDGSSIPPLMPGVRPAPGSECART